MSPFTKKIGATWLVTCIAGSVLFTIGFGFYTGRYSDTLMMLPSVFGISLFISLVAFIPVFLLYGLAIRALIRSDYFSRMAGRCLLAIALPYAILVILFLFLGAAYASLLVSIGMFIPIPYAIIFLTCAFLYDPTEKKTLKYGEETIPAVSHVKYYIIIIALSLAGLYYEARGLIATYSIYLMHLQGIGIFSETLNVLFFLAHITALLLMGFKKKAGWSLFLLLTANHALGFAYFFITTNGVLHALQQNPRLTTDLLISTTVLVIILLPSMRKAYGVTRKTTITTIAAAVGLFILINLLQFFANHFQ